MVSNHHRILRIDRKSPDFWLSRGENALIEWQKSSRIAQETKRQQSGNAQSIGNIELDGIETDGANRMRREQSIDDYGECVIFGYCGQHVVYDRIRWNHHMKSVFEGPGMNVRYMEKNRGKLRRIHFPIMIKR